MATEPGARPLPSPRSAVPTPGGVARLVLSGATGRLGGAVVEVARAQGLPLAGAVASPRRRAGGERLPSIGPDGAALAVSSSDELADLLRRADVYVACAPAGPEMGHLRAAADAGCPVVLASTGFSPDEELRLTELSGRIPILREANFSPGLNWLRRALLAARPPPPGFDLGLLEAHRAGKRDRPSGTARTLARDLGLEATDADGPSAVQSLRLGELPGVHQLWLASGSELLRMEHLVLDRRAFADGIVAAARWMAARGPTLPPGWYGLDDVYGAPAEVP